MNNKIILLLSIFLLNSCNYIQAKLDNNISNNTRYFQFIYEVGIEPTENKKMELWIPIPQTNEVQIISELSYELAGLEYELKTESNSDKTDMLDLLQIVQNKFFELENTVSGSDSLFFDVSSDLKNIQKKMELMNLRLY